MKTPFAAALALSFVSSLALTACGEPAAEPQTEMSQDDNAMTDDGMIDTAPVTEPEGQVDADGLGPDEAYGERGDQSAPQTNIPEDGEAADITGEGDDTEILED